MTCDTRQQWPAERFHVSLRRLGGLVQFQAFDPLVTDLVFCTAQQRGKHCILPEPEPTNTPRTLVLQCDGNANLYTGRAAPWPARGQRAGGAQP